MRIIISLLLFTFLGNITVLGQKKNISIIDIYSGKFSTKTLDIDAFSVSNGKKKYIPTSQKGFYFLQQTEKGTDINLLSYTTQEKLCTLYSIPNIYFNQYSFDNQEKKLLIPTETEFIYRRSQKSKYNVYDIKTSKLTSVFDEKIQVPLFSPQGDKIAFVFDNNLYIKDLENENVIQITNDGKKNEVINGLADWVYEEEFSVIRMFDWSKDGKKIAFIRFDESEVPTFSMDIYGSGLYPTQKTFKYPKAGENNSKVSAFIYDLDTKKTEKIEIDNPYYIPRLEWTNEDNVLSLRVCNRNQNEFKVLYYNYLTKKYSVVYSEKDKAYVEIENQKFHIFSNNNFLISSEKEGFRHLYYYDKTGKLLKKITQGNWEVTDLYGVNEKNRTIYYQSNERGSINKDIYAISLDGKNKKLLSKQLGTNNALFSLDFSLYINEYQSVITPPIVELLETSSLNTLAILSNDEECNENLNLYSTSRKEFFTIKVKDKELNMSILKPDNFDSYKKYPVLMYQYSGPGSQSVLNEWLDFMDYWHLSLTQKGYIIACIDGLGTGGKGADFKKITQLQLGKYETESQIAAAEYLARQSFIDNSRIGIWGWSFGGFISTSCILKGNSIFKTAIAVAPVTDWLFYDTIYTERYMQTPADNPNGYKENSPLNMAKKLNGNFLLIHGTADDNVHIQNSMRMIEALVQENRAFDWAIYPDKNHGIYGGYTRIQLFEKMTNYILKNL
ncbi:MAG: S9 family peptidase [Capnocytophaga sp.]|nr:S9 family peptidase [Capnocytophaga sp.]